jgi:hypothetical protein
MTKGEEKETPTTFKYSIWDTRTADDQPNIHVTSSSLHEETQIEEENPK